MIETFPNSFPQTPETSATITQSCFQTSPAQRTIGHVDFTFKLFLLHFELLRFLLRVLACR